MTSNRKRVHWSRQETIKAPAATIFPLLCPVLEEKWIPDWQYEMVYSDSGVNETNCIFTEDVSGPFVVDAAVTTAWHTIVHDPENNEIIFFLVQGDRSVVRVDVKIEANDCRTSTVIWDMTFTSMSPLTDELGDDQIKAGLVGFIDFIASLLKHYCETGEMLRA